MATITNVQNTTSHTLGAGRRALRRLGRGLAWVAGAIAVLGLSGAFYESAAEAADVRAYPPPGQLVDVGGYRLHITCVGTGSPTVIIEAGWGDWSASWSGRVQPAVARTTRVCTYDRAGMGYSDPGPLPRDARQFATELHTLLQRAAIPGPYVLAGHSLGGLSVRVFAHLYPADVAGVVLLDSMSPGQATPAAVAAAPQAAGSPSGLSIYTLPARVGLVRLLAGPLDLASGLAPEVADACLARSVTPRHIQTTLDEGSAMPASMAQAGAVTTFGDIPLIVLSRGVGSDPSWRALQTDLLQLSAQSQQLFADKSGHNIQLEQPAAAAAAIAQMVAQLRQP